MFPIRDWDCGCLATSCVPTEKPDDRFGNKSTDRKLQPIFIAGRAGIPKEVRRDKLSNLDVALTLAALVGLRMKEAKRRAVQKIAGAHN